MLADEDIPEDFRIPRGQTEPLGVRWELPINLHGVIAHQQWLEWRDVLIALRAKQGPVIVVTRQDILGSFTVPAEDLSLPDRNSATWKPGGHEERARGTMPWQTDLVNWRIPVGVIVARTKQGLGDILAYLLRSAQDNPATAYQVGTVILEATLAQDVPVEIDAILRLGRKHNCTAWIVGDESAQTWARFVGTRVMTGPGRSALVYEGDPRPVEVPFSQELATQGRRLLQSGGK